MRSWCVIFFLNDLFDVLLFVLFCEPRRGDFYFAVLVCCLFGINDLFDVRLFVLFCEPRCGDFDFAFLAVKTVNCGLPERGCGKQPRSIVVWF